MEQDKVRAEFEAWVLRSVTDSTRADLFRVGDCYEWERLNWEFAAWKASREAVVVELPYAGTLLAPQWNEAIDRCRAAIHAAGIRTK